MDSLYVSGDSHQSILNERRPRPARSSALLLASAVQALNDAERRLEKAKASVPNYTAQYSDIDYYSGAQENYNRACEAYEDAIRASCGLEPLTRESEPSEFQVSMSRKVEDAFPVITPSDRKLLDKYEIVYVGDLVDVIDRNTTGRLSMPNLKIIQDIPTRLGTEVWVRP